MKYLNTFEQQIVTELDLSNSNLTELPELPNKLERLSFIVKVNLYT